jgi:hypothetical protein
MSTVPLESLRLRALQQRRELHQTVCDLRKKIDHTRDKLRIKKHVREHLLAFSLAGSALALLLGYAVARVFTQD